MEWVRLCSGLAPVPRKENSEMALPACLVWFGSRGGRGANQTRQRWSAGPSVNVFELNPTNAVMLGRACPYPSNGIRRQRTQKKQSKIIILYLRASTTSFYHLLYSTKQLFLFIRSAGVCSPCISNPECHSIPFQRSLNGICSATEQTLIAVLIKSKVIKQDLCVCCAD
jgi:hypothetical protein